MVKCIGVLTSGGDAPGMNAAVRAVARTCLNKGIEVYGVKLGYKGLHDGEFIKFDRHSTRNIINIGGTMLKSARFPEFKDPEVRKEAIEKMKEVGMEALVVIGGDGSYNGALKLTEMGINCIGIPGTIDRDVSCSEYTLGFDTAANTATEAIDKIRDSSISHGRCSVVEVMGRKRGYIALWAGMATSADAIILPEKWDGNYDNVTDAIKRRHEDGRNSYLVVVAEGVTDANELADLIKKKTGIESRVSVLGYIQRGGQPSAKDRMYGSLMGAYAVEILMNGNKNRIVAIKDDKLIDYSINEALNIQNSQIDSFQYKLSLLLSD